VAIVAGVGSLLGLPRDIQDTSKMGGSGRMSITDSDRLDSVKKIIREWLDQQGHDRCWYYPDIFNRLVRELELKPTKEPALPAREEFERGCRKYADEQYKESRSREERGKMVRDAYRQALFHLYKTNSSIPAWDEDESELGKDLDKLIGDILFEGRVG
jgi:hypothetical protein